MNHYRSKFFCISVFVSLFLISSGLAYAASSGRNTAKDKQVKIKFVVKATKLAAKSYALKQYGRNINILSNRILKSSVIKEYGLKNSPCRRIVLKTKGGDRKTLNICEKSKG